MTYNFLTLEPLSLDTVAAALARCLNVDVHEVEVADEGTDQDLRNWEALVLCEKTTVRGDVSTSLDVYVQQSVDPQPTERELASAFAWVTGAVVLFPAQEAVPSAYWAATAEGSVTRARLDVSDDDEARYTVETVEAPVAQLPRASVARIAEVVREQPIATPLAEAFAAHLNRLHPVETSATGSPFWLASDRLAAWEKLVRHMESAWASSGWCPPDLYLERLRARDELEGLLRSQLPDSVAVLLQNALDSLDALFTELTVPDPGVLREELLPADVRSSTNGWWWDRRPDPLPW
ncbi:MULTISPECIES: hypothetical protein [Streptomyces]|uniref:Uncharacterized protein n=2 Tax=Streptomyces TaxID=1883 RepID=A0A2U9P886_STRAS|nr:hypothetical protein [Streptomyces actuosus]AWT45198.1 hypothetical protein DMT42_24850 [Streptomyces actuosus]MBM4821784.1 hypothetical protein [Streptomyces actuosus]